VTAVRRENYRTVSLHLDASAPLATPGQFAMLWLPGLDEKPFSLMDGDPLAFTIAAVGPFSRAVTSLAPGDQVWWRGPFGRGFDLDGLERPILAGGGYGVAPLLFATRRMAASGASADGSAAVGRARVAPRVAVGARSADDLMLVEDLVGAGAEVRATTEDGSAGEAGLVTHAIRALAAAQKPDAILACGPHGMLSAIGALAAEMGVPVQLSWEAYMRCGIGICGSCEHEGMLLCADGPVLCWPPAGGGP
jgi:dihydroorotate dehydrogenase electron transfer subunit